MKNLSDSELTIAKQDKWLRVLPYGIAGLFFLAYLSFLKSIDVWTDEAYMMQMLRETNTLKDAVLYAASDTHPPAYFVALKMVTMIFGQNLVAAKMLSIGAVTGTILLGVHFLLQERGVKSAIFYALLVGAIPCSMDFSVEIRMYSLALFFLTGCGINAFRFITTEKKRYLVACTLFGVGAAYTHYFSLAAVALILGMMFCVLIVTNRKLLKYWIVSIVICIALYIPWLPYFYVQFTRVSTGFWIPEITGRTLLEYLEWYFGTDMPYCVWMLAAVMLVAIVLLIGEVIVERNRRTVWACACFLVWFLTIVVGVVVSAAIRPMFLIKYSYPMLGLLSIALAWALHRLPERTALVLMCFLFCIGIVDYENTYQTEYESTMTVKTMQFFEENLKEGDKVAYNYHAFGFIYRFYFTEEQLVELSDIDFEQEDGDADIYLMHTTWNELPSTEQLAANGWKQEYMGMYGIEHNEFKIFHYYK